MLFQYLRNHWVARGAYPLHSRILALLRMSRVLLFYRKHLELGNLDIFKNYLAPVSANDLFRHLSRRHYLAKNLSWRKRVECAMHHYRFEDGNFGARYKRLVYLAGGLPLWSRQERGTSFTICLLPGIGLDAEGDLSVVLLADGERLHCISFSWVSGKFAGVDAPAVPFVTRNQGRWRRDQDIQHRFDSAFPQNSANLFCFSAMEGIARAIGASCMIGVHAGVQVCYSEKDSRHFANAYDGFWRTVGATESSVHGMIIPVPFPVRPLTDVSAKHRKRALERRRHWAEISGACEAAVMEHIVGPAGRRVRAIRDAGGRAADIELGRSDRLGRERRRVSR